MDLSSFSFLFFLVVKGDGCIEEENAKKKRLGSERFFIYSETPSSFMEHVLSCFRGNFQIP